MPNKRLNLFIKTWPPPKTKTNIERPLTATLDKPSVLNINFINKIDMTRMGEELLAIRNLCLIPVNGDNWIDGKKQENTRKRPLSAIGAKSSYSDECSNNGKCYIKRYCITITVVTNVWHFSTIIVSAASKIISVNSTDRGLRQRP